LSAISFGIEEPIFYIACALVFVVGLLFFLQAGRAERGWREANPFDPDNLD